MTPVEFRFITPNDVPLDNAVVLIQLSRPGFGEEEGILMPRELQVRTDSNGEVTVPLYPSNAPYFVTVEDTESFAALSYKFYVPELEEGVVSVRLQDIVVDGEVSQTPYDEAAILTIVNSKITAVDAKVQAQLARDAAVEAAEDAEVSRVAAYKVIKHIGPTPPVDPVDGREWFNDTNGKTYVWLASNGVWVEGHAAIVVDIPDSSEGGAAFNPGSLVSTGSINNPSTVNFLIEQGGVAYRITAAQMLASLGVEAEDLQNAGPLAGTDYLTVTQADGTEKKTTLAALAAAIKSINGN